MRMSAIVKTVPSMVTVVLLFARPAAGDDTSYEGHELLRVQLESPDDVAVIQDIGALAMGDGIAIGMVDVIVPPGASSELNAAGIEFSILSDNVGDYVDYTRSRLAINGPIEPDSPDFPLIPYGWDPSTQSCEQFGNSGWFADYRSYTEIFSKLLWWHNNHASFVSLESIGHGFEPDDREIWALHIGDDDPGKPILLIYAAIHAREWVTPMAAMYIAQQFIDSHGSSSTLGQILEQVEIVVIPVMNPDGYVHTWDPNGDFFWRKNRNPLTDCSSSSIDYAHYGVDLNRNWETPEWNDAAQGVDMCEQFYPGEYPDGYISEPENQALRDYVVGEPRIVAALDLHTYYKSISLPYAY